MSIETKERGDIEKERGDIDRLVRAVAFMDAVREHGAIAGHPATIAMLREMAPDAIGTARLVESVHIERGQLYSGELVAEMARLLDRAAAVVAQEPTA